MHHCDDCGQVCYCDLDDSNDCRDNGECFHECDPEPDEWGGDEDEADPEMGAAHGR